MELKVRWHVTSQFFEKIKPELDQHDIQYRKGLAIDPASGILMVITSSLLIGLIHKVYKDIRYCGLIVDVTKKPIEIKEMPHWDRSQILLVTEKDAQILKLSDDDGNLKVLSKLIDKLG